MGKRLALILVCLSFLAYGCEAFKNYYDEPPENELLNSESEQPANVEAKSVMAGVVDYGVDKTPCSNVSGLMASVVSDVAADNSGWTTDGDSVSITTEKLGPFTSHISITKGLKKLSLTVKQVSKDTAYVCDVVYEDCEGECLGVKSLWSDVKMGFVEIYKLNEMQGGEVANAGAYEITFGKSNMGEEGLTVEGSYYADILGEALIK